MSWPRRHCSQRGKQSRRRADSGANDQAEKGILSCALHDPEAGRQRCERNEVPGQEGVTEVEPGEREGEQDRGRRVGVHDDMRSPIVELHAEIAPHALMMIAIDRQSFEPVPGRGVFLKEVRE